MRTTKYLLIGGGLASSRAADQIRKRDPIGPIALVTDEPYPPYDRPPLSKEFLRRRQTRDSLLYRPVPELAGQGIDLTLGVPVRSLDLDRGLALLDDGTEIGYERAMLATGGRPVRLGLPGEDLPGVHYLRTIADSEGILADAESARRVVIVGAGFIGIEAAAALTELGLEVTVLETAPRLWPHFADESVAEFFRRYCSERGVRFRTEETATAILGEGRASSVATVAGHEYECDFALICAGIVPNVEIAAHAGLAVDDGIVVDGRMRTSHEAVYAAGDVVNYPDPVFGKRRRVEHWGHAEHGGQIAGMNIAGGKQEYSLLSYVWSDAFDLHLEFAGDESECDRTLVRGEPDTTSFTVLLLKENRLTAYFSINGDRKEFGPLQKLIRRQVDLGSKEAQLTDPTSKLRALL